MFGVLTPVFHMCVSSCVLFYLFYVISILLHATGLYKLFMYMRQ